MEAMTAHNASELWACSFRKIGRNGMIAPNPIHTTNSLTETTPS